MAGIKVVGYQELIDRFNRTISGLDTEGVEVLKQAAVDVFLPAIRAATPVGTQDNKSKKRPGHGELKRSVRVTKGKSNALTSTGKATKLAVTRVGPEKKHGYYGYWLETGWKMPLYTTFYYTRAGRWHPENVLIKTKRRRRPTELAVGTHTQMGTSYVKVIPPPYKDWFRDVIRNVTGEALRKGFEAFDAILKKYAS